MCCNTPKTQKTRGNTIVNFPILTPFPRQFLRHKFPLGSIRLEIYPIANQYAQYTTRDLQFPIQSLLLSMIIFMLGFHSVPNLVPRVFHVLFLASRQPLSQGLLSTSRKYPGYGWSRVYAFQLKPHGGWVLDLSLSTLSREVNVALLCRRYFEREGSYLSKILSDRSFISAQKYEMLTERELCLYFTVFLK